MSTAPTWEIHNALARLAHLADDGDVEEYLDQFTPDAVWEASEVPATGMKADRRTGREQIREGVVTRRAQGMQGPGSATRHTVHTIEVLAGADDTTAASVTYWSFFMKTTTAATLAGVGRYDDRWQLADDGWKLAHRRITAG